MESEQAKFKITSLSETLRGEIAWSVKQAVDLYPNSHLGDFTPRQDIHSAFRIIRQHTAYNDGDIWAGIGALRRDVDTHRNM